MTENKSKWEVLQNPLVGVVISDSHYYNVESSFVMKVENSYNEIWYFSSTLDIWFKKEEICFNDDSFDDGLLL